MKRRARTNSVVGLVVAGFVRLVLVARLVRLAHLLVVVLAGLVVVPRLVMVVAGLVPIAAGQMEPGRLGGLVVVVRLVPFARLVVVVSAGFPRVRGDGQGAGMQRHADSRGRDDREREHCHQNVSQRHSPPSDAKSRWRITLIARSSK